MSDPVDGAAPEAQDEFDRVWRMLDQNTAAIHGIETELVKLARVLGLRENPTRQVGDYFPDPVRDPLTAIRAILSEMLPPSGIHSHAQRLLLRIKAVVVGGEAAAGEASEGAESSRSGSATAGERRRGG